MSMFASACVSCGPTGAAYWTVGNNHGNADRTEGSSGSGGTGVAMATGGVSGAAALIQQQAAAYSDAIKRTSSFFITDILYPSIIPLPGTLPHGSPPRATPRTPTSPHSPSTGPDSNHRLTPTSPPCHHDNTSRDRSRLPSPPPVKSKDLKFGIDRILCGRSAKDITIATGM